MLRKSTIVLVAALTTFAVAGCESRESSRGVRAQEIEDFRELSGGDCSGLDEEFVSMGELYGPGPFLWLDTNHFYAKNFDGTGRKPVGFVARRFQECVLLEESYIPENSCFVFEVSKSPDDKLMVSIQGREKSIDAIARCTARRANQRPQGEHESVAIVRGATPFKMVLEYPNAYPQPSP